MEHTKNPATVKDAMGHEDLKTTMSYLHPDLSVIREVINRKNSMLRSIPARGSLRLLQLLLKVAGEFDLQPAWQRGLPGHQIPFPTSFAVLTALHERGCDLDLGFQ